MATSIPKVTAYSGNIPALTQQQSEFNQNTQAKLDYDAQVYGSQGVDGQLNSTIDAMNLVASEVEASAASAEQSASNAEASASMAGYQGLWPDSGGSAIKGETWQTQVGGVPTGEYFTALKNTTVAPVDDNINWKAQNDHDALVNRESVNSHPASAISTTATGYSVQELSDSHNPIQKFGGNDGGITDNTSAIIAAKAAGIKIVKLPFLTTGIYYFAGDTVTLFADITFACDKGVKISLQQTDNYNLVDDIKTQGDLVIFDRNINREYKTSDDDLKKLAIPLVNRSSKPVAISTASSNQLFQATGVLGSDGLTPQTFSDYAGLQLTMPSLTANNFAVVAYPCEINERVGFNWSDDSYSKGACVITKDEIYLLYSSTTSDLNLYYKESGVSAVTGTISKPVKSYSLESAQVSIQRVDNTTCRVLTNGVSLSGLIPDIKMKSDILYVGSVYVSGGLGESVYVKNFFRDECTAISNVNYELAIYGDSLTDVYANNWPDLTKSILQANGHSISISNYAEAGETSTQQLARFNANGLGNANLFAFVLGTNDVQTTAGVNTLLNNLDTFYTAINTANRKLVVGVPPMWMSQTMGGGTGYSTSNYDKGADYRGSVIRYCLDRGIEYFEMSTLFGYVNNQSNEFIRDNIHQSAIGYAATAISAANTIMNILKPTGFKRAWRDLTGIGASPYTGLEAKISLDETKSVAEFKGLFDIGGLTINDGDQLFRVESRYVPQTDKYISVTTSYGAAAHVRIDSNNGIVSAYNFGTVPPSAWFSVEGLKYYVV